MQTFLPDDMKPFREDEFDEDEEADRAVESAILLETSGSSWIGLEMSGDVWSCIEALGDVWRSPEMS